MESETKRDLAWLSFVGVFFFISSLILSSVGGLYNSPDETANAFFAQTFAEHGRLYVFEPLNTVLDDALFPRSVVALDGRLLPGSFLGLPVFYGVAMRVFGNWALFLLTPMIAILAVLAWYGVVRALFGRRIGRLAALLLFAHPAWWYYTTRGLMHNVLFTALLMFCAFFLVVRPLENFHARAGCRSPYPLDVLAGGLLLGLALFVRTSEAVWIGLVVLLAIVLFFKKLHWSRVLLFFCATLLALSPMFFLNRSLYGSVFSTGYTIKDEAERVIFAAHDDEFPFLDGLGQLLTPFGIHPRDAFTNLRLYGVEMFWWFSILILVGIPLALPTRAESGERRLFRIAFVLSAVLVTAWLVLVYGSWTIHDNPDPSVVTIGNSYVRYWLPAFVMSTPFAALAVVWLCERPLTIAARHLAYTAVILLVFALGVRTTFFAGPDALVPMAQRIEAYVAIRDRVLAITESSAVIIVDRADKLFFPHRRVVYPLRAKGDATYDLMPRLVLRAPLYYYGITLPDADLDYLNTRKLKERGLVIELVDTYTLESLYKISQVP